MRSQAAICSVVVTATTVWAPCTLVLLAAAGPSPHLHRGTRPLAGALSAAGVTEVRGDLADPEDLARALGEGADLLVDCIGYDASDAQRVVTGSADLGSAVVISSAAVYTDAQGAIHGRYARNPREWNVLKHILDGRRHVVLAHGGSSSFQTTAARTGWRPRGDPTRRRAVRRRKMGA